MTAFLTAPSNLPFSVALALMLLLVLVELVGFLAGLGVSDLLHGHLPEFAEADGAEVTSESVAGRFMGWLGIGRVPALIVLALFLTGFGLLGLVVQALAVAWFGTLLSAWVAAPAAFFLALPWVRVSSLVLGRVLPRDETQVASRRSLVGHVATIVIGHARAGSPAQAKVRDDVGQTQYVMVEPESADTEFAAGDAVLLVAQAGALFRGRRADPALSLLTPDPSR
jgi:hypothetical protein